MWTTKNRARYERTGLRYESDLTDEEYALIERPGHVWSIRAKLQLERRTRDLTLFNLAIDSKLRGCDLIALRVD